MKFHGIKYCNSNVTNSLHFSNFIASKRPRARGARWIPIPPTWFPPPPPAIPAYQSAALAYNVGGSAQYNSYG